MGSVVSEQSVEENTWTWEMGNNRRTENIRPI